ncbi:MAG TPA: YfhO family protein [Thermoleophilaceae bacterium]|nr:YfhO family protein [Thermoleophilaceae bacterium]
MRRGFEGLRRRPVLAAALIYALLALIFVGPGLLPGKTLSNSDMLRFQPPWLGVKPAELKLPANPELGDAPGQLQPFVRYAADTLPDMPLWNPYTVAGRPFLANAQSAIFSVYNVPAYVLPYFTALGIIALLKLWVSAFGMFLLGRALGMRFGGALTAGLVYAFSLWMVTWVSYPHMSVWSWMPWLLLLTERLVRRPDLLSGALLAGMVGVQILAGHPESSFHSMLTMAAFFVLRVVQSRRRADGDSVKPLRTTLVFGGATVGGLLLAALLLIPFAELLLNSADVRDRMGDAVDKQPVARDFALGLFLPEYWGRATETPLKYFVLDRAVYIGALPLMLAGAALIIRPTLERVCVALYGALWLAVVFGVPPFLQIVTRLPIFSSGHNSRLTALFVFSFALLAGWGLDELTRAEWSPRRRKLTLALAAALTVLPALFVIGAGRTSAGALGEAIEVAWGFATPPGVTLNDNGGRTCIEPCGEAGDVIRLASLLAWLVLAGAALLLVALRLSGRLRLAPFVALAALLVCADLFYTGMGYNPAIERKFADQPRTGSIRYLESRAPARFVSMDAIPQNAIPMNFRLYEARGYDLPIMRRFDRLWRGEVSPESSSVSKGLLDTPLTLRELTPRGLRMLRLLGVTDIQQDNRAPVLQAPGLSVAYEGPDARVYSVAGALPRAWVAPVQSVVDSDDAALRAVTRPGFDARRVTITEERLEGVPEQSESGGARGAAAQVVSYEPERVVVRARSAGQGMLVLGDNHYPGWKAKVDGNDADITRVNYLFRGVRVGPGTHTVEFRYEPLSWRAGWIISLLSLLALIAAIVIGARRRRERHPVGSRSPRMG